MLAKNTYIYAYCNINMHQAVIELSYVDCVLVPVDAGFLVEVLIVRPDDGPIGQKHVA